MRRALPQPLPMTREEAQARGWDELDVVLVTGDAYVDHPSFGAAVIGRVLEAAGFRVGIIAQPDWRSADNFRRLGRPRLFFGVTAGNLDSLLNHYTALKRRRREDAYTPGGRAGARPDRATIVYANRAAEAFPGVPIVLGGVEASLRRISHYDFWDDAVRRSVLLDSMADLLVYGMGEQAVTAIARRLAAGEPVSALRDIPGTAYRCGPGQEPAQAQRLPDHEQAAADRQAFLEMHRQSVVQARGSGRALAQRAGKWWVVVNPPAPALEPAALDASYALPYSRRAHPSYAEPVPALEMIQFSLTSHRGCFGGCAFCSLYAHQGRAVQSRTRQSVVAEARQLAAHPDFRGTISDVGGPTANSYGMTCRKGRAERGCPRPSCLYPEICPSLETSHSAGLALLEAVAKVPGVKHVFVASGVRHDLALRDPEYVRALAHRYVGGHLKIAPEHFTPEVLALMRKPGPECYLLFDREFRKRSEEVGKEQYVLPYLMAGHPGCGLHDMQQTADFMRRQGIRVEQVQLFTPLPMTDAACMWHTGRDPATGRRVQVVRSPRQRAAMLALLQGKPRGRSPAQTCGHRRMRRK